MRRERIADRAASATTSTDLAAQRAGTLSGGQRQRLALGAATLHEPELLLLDEPTSAVDPQSRRDFWESLFALVDGGTTILVSTHYMDEAERCHRLAILDRGRIAAEGEPKALARDIDAVVIEIGDVDFAAARRALAAVAEVRSVAQLGNRLRVLMPRGDAPSRSGAARGARDGNPRRDGASRSAPRLEDVFVAATRTARRSGRRAPHEVARAACSRSPARRCASSRATASRSAMIVGIPTIQLLLFGYAINFDVRGVSTARARPVADTRCRARLVGDLRRDAGARRASARRGTDARAARADAAGRDQRRRSSSRRTSSGARRRRAARRCRSSSTAASPALENVGDPGSRRCRSLRRAGTTAPREARRSRSWSLYNPERRTAVQIVPALCRRDPDA